MGNWPNWLSGGLRSSAHAKKLEHTETPILSKDEEIVKSRFVGNEPDSGCLREGKWSRLYEAILASGVYRPGAVEKEMLVEHRHEMQPYIREALVMLGVGNWEKEQLLLTDYQRLSLLRIAGVEPSIPQANRAAKSFTSFAKKQKRTLLHPPAFTTQGDEDVTFGSFFWDEKRLRRTYTNLGFNSARHSLAYHKDLLKRLFPVRLRGQDDTYIFSYHVAPATDDHETIAKIEAVYSNAPSEEFVMQGIENHMHKIWASTWYVFDRLQRTYDVSYNTKLKQVEVGAIPLEEVYITLSDWTVLHRSPGERLIVHTSKRFTERDITSFLRDQWFDKERERVDRSVWLVVASNKLKTTRVQGSIITALVFTLLIGGVALLHISEGIKQKRDRIAWTRKSAAEDWFAKVMNDYTEEELRWVELEERRQYLTDKMIELYDDIYDHNEGTYTFMHHLISDWVRNNTWEGGNAFNRVYMEEYDLMHALTQAIIPQHSESLIAQGGELYPYADIGRHEDIMFNTLFPDEMIPTMATETTGMEEFEPNFKKFLGVYPVVALDENEGVPYKYMYEIFTDGYRFYAHRQPANYVKEGVWFDKYEFSNATREAGETAILSISFRRYPLLQKAYDRITKRYESKLLSSVQTQRLAVVLTRYFMHGRFKGGMRGYELFTPREHEIWNVVDKFEAYVAADEDLSQEFGTPNIEMKQWETAVENMKMKVRDADVSMHEDWSDTFEKIYIQFKEAHQYNFREVGTYTTKFWKSFYVGVFTLADGKDYILAYDIKRNENDIFSRVFSSEAAREIINDYDPNDIGIY